MVSELFVSYFKLQLWYKVEAEVIGTGCFSRYLSARNNIKLWIKTSASAADDYERHNIIHMSSTLDGMSISKGKQLVFNNCVLTKR